MKQFDLISKWETVSTNGVTSKGIYIDINNTKWLVKGNSKNGGLEPYSEALSSVILESLNIHKNDYVKYYILNHKDFLEVNLYDNCNHVSVCKLLEYPIYQFYSTFSLKEIIFNRVFEKYKEVKGLSLEWLYRLFIIDAFIGNTDRHWNNIDIIQKRNGIYRNAPMLDFGRSLLYNIPDEDLDQYSKYNIGPDNCKPLKPTHELQLKEMEKIIRNYKPFNYISKKELLNKIISKGENIFNNFTEERYNVIMSYLDIRYELYLEKYMYKDTKAHTVNW